MKGTFPKSTFTWKDRTINYPYTAAVFREETIDKGNTVALILYGQDATDMKEAAQVIIDNASALAGAPNAQIRPATVTPDDTNNDREREMIQTEVSPPMAKLGDTSKGNRKKYKKDK